MPEQPQCYKVLRRDRNGNLISCIARGVWQRRYEPGKPTMGYNAVYDLDSDKHRKTPVTAFSTLPDAIAFTKGIPCDEIWLCAYEPWEAEHPMSRENNSVLLLPLRSMHFWECLWRSPLNPHIFQTLLPTPKATILCRSITPLMKVWPDKEH